MTGQQDEEKKCRLCLQPFVPYPLGTKNDYDLEACKACGSVMANPYPTQELLDNFYGEIQPQVTHLPNRDSEVLRIKKTLLQMLPVTTNKRFLDVAARQGYGVKAAHILGMKAFGIDSHSFYTEFAQSKYPPDMFQNISVQDYAATDPEKYDIVLAELCFNEQPDLEAYTASLASLVKPGGLIYINEVDGNHWNLPRNFDNFPYIDPPISFLFPSKSGMEALLGRYNLRIQKMFFTWKPFMRMFVERIP
ncbi:MAG: methyltransferase domain-containing protein [Alphaproteobacteria bacterium]|nr:methyltransferase domain-containing protein [Alphaproteobacteria bacterium]